MVDPDGRLAMPFDDYRLSQNGSINLIKRTNDNFDRLESSTKNSIIVSNGTLGTKAVDVNQTPVSYNDAREIFVTSNNSEAVKVFEFAAENSKVEFQLTKVENKDGIEVSLLRTDHKSGSVGTEHLEKLQNKGFEIKDIKHSHPGGPGNPSGFDDNGKINPSARRTGDLNTAQKYPNAKHSVYDTKTEKYTYYDENKANIPK